MDKGLVMVLGMSMAYVASLLGMGLAWWAWRRRHREERDR
jgi:nicotinamide riboside transporter PnuC